MSTPVIKIAVSQADATLIQSVTLTAGMVSLPEVKFSFTDEWTGLGKKAIVRAGNTAKEVLITNNKIIVPVECLETAGVDLIIGVYGADETVVLPTVWCACGEILDGTDTSGADNQGEATTTLVDQMLAYAADIEAIAETLEDYAIRNVEVNTTGANQYGIATVTLADTGSGDDRTITFHFSNLKGNGIESITWSAAGEYRGRIQITESSGRVTNFDALIDAINYLENLINRAEAWAVGTIDGVPVEDIDPDDPAYQNNAKYYAEMAEDAETGAEAAQEAAETAQGKAEDAQEAAETAQGKAEDAQTAAETAATSASGAAGSAAGSASSAAGSASSASDSASAAASARDAAELAQAAAENSASAASGSASSASTQALKSEGFAVGKQNNVDVDSGSTYYHNNAKYYKEQAAESATDASGYASSASNDASAASGSASSASTNALKAEGYAVGKQNGTDVASGSPYYENNAKYYADEASDSATAAAESAATFETDTTLSVSGKAADAKATGDALASQSEKIDDKYDKQVITINDTASVSFFDSVGGNLITSLKINILYTQEGSGTPSLNNVRQISGISTINLTNNGTVIPIELKDENENSYTIYKGEIDLITGIATINGVLNTFTGSSVTDYGTASGMTYVRVSSSKRLSSSTIGSLISNCFFNGASGVDGAIYIPSYSSNNVRLYSSAFTSKAVAQSIMNETPIQMYYDVPAFTVQLQPNELKTVIGQNIISIDIGNFSITYKEDFDSAVKNLITESYGLSTDALLYADKIPSYYINPETTPVSFAEAQSYLDDKINSLPKGKSFIFITDTHWDGNEKHSTYLINYIRKRTGINKVLFGGDVFGNATTKYLGVRKAGLYLNESKRAIGYDYIPCVGDHDNNTVNVAGDDTHWIPYSETEKLFVSDLERYPKYHFYDCSKKLASYATVGSDDYNDAMCFFHTVFYVDDTDSKIRYISLNCGNGGNYGAMYNIFGDGGSSLLRLQFPWLIETLMSTPKGYDIVVLSHKGNTAYSGASSNGLNRILTAFKRKANLTNACAYSSGLANIESWFPYNSNYNFSDAPDVGIIICLNGHDHGTRLDKAGVASGSWISHAIGSTTYYFASAQSGDTIIQTGETGASDCIIPIITTPTDSIGSTEATSPSMTSGTVTEQCFDIITIGEDKIYMTRIGAGEDRSLTLIRNVT